MTKKSDAIQKKEDSFQVVEVKSIDNQVSQTEETDLSRRQNKPPPAYTLGKVVGYIGSFLLGFLRNQRHFDARDVDEGMGKGERRRRYREKRRAIRRR